MLFLPQIFRIYHIIGMIISMFPTLYFYTKNIQLLKALSIWTALHWLHNVQNLGWWKFLGHSHSEPSLNRENAWPDQMLQVRHYRPRVCAENLFFAKLCFSLKACSIKWFLIKLRKLSDCNIIDIRLWMYDIHNCLLYKYTVV